MRRHFAAQIREIAGDSALRGYGAALAALHGLTCFWLLHFDVAHLVASDQPAICWPLVPGCEALRVLSARGLAGIFWIYGAAAALVALAFARRRWTARGYLGLVALVLFQVLILALDFRLRRNQHYMALAVTGAFLLVPRKREALRLLLVLFYFWAGTLKLNWEWISGAGLYRPLWFFAGRGVIFACSYVIVLELVIVWGLLARRSAVFWGALAQVVLFHVFSWGVVGFFYPLLMFGLLSLFPLCRLPGPAEAPEGPGLTLVRRGGSRPAYAVAVAFSLLQLAPHLYPGDTALTGEGRLYALHMFDARIECEAYATLKVAPSATARVDLRGDGTRIACDPVLIHGAARNLCRGRAAGGPAFQDLDLRLNARRTTEPAYTAVIAVDDFCQRQPQYHPLWHNDWIGPPAAFGRPPEREPQLTKARADFMITY